MVIPEPDPLMAAVPVDIRPWLAATLSEGDGSWLGTQAATEAARQAVARWARAVDGDEAVLATVAEPAVVHRLLYRLSLQPPDERIAAGAVVSRIEIRGLELTAGAPRLRLAWQFTGRLQPEPPRWAGHVWEFFGRLELTFAAAGAPPWLLTSGDVSYLSSVPEYWYTSRDETAAEYEARTGSAAGMAALAPSSTYQVRADFAEHDFRVGGTATVEVRSETTPTRYAAEEIAESAVMAEAERLIGPGEGDLRPSMSRLELIRLLQAASTLR